MVLSASPRYDPSEIRARKGSDIHLDDQGLISCLSSLYKLIAMHEVISSFTARVREAAAQRVTTEAAESLILKKIRLFAASSYAMCRSRARYRR